MTGAIYIIAPAKKHIRVKSIERIHGIGVNIEQFKGNPSIEDLQLFVTDINGYLVEMNDVEEMAKYILELHDNQDLREAMIKQAQNDIVKYEINSVIKEEKIIRSYL